MSTIYLYPAWVRLWHLFNALLCLILIVTGLSLQYSSTDYMLIRFDLSVTIHNVAGILLTVNYLVILFGNMFTKSFRSTFRYNPRLAKSSQSAR